MQTNQPLHQRRQLLVSVRSLAEAEICLQHDVAIIDLKEPNAGALGPVDQNVMDQVSARLTKHLPETTKERNHRISFAAGELHDWNFETFPRLIDRYPSDLIATFRFVKIGLSNANSIARWQSRWTQLFSDLPSSTTPVAVAYFDYERCAAPSIDDTIKLAAANDRCTTLLLDTYHKDCDLFGSISRTNLEDVVVSAKAHSLAVVVAGSVNITSLDSVLAAGPDIIGVRGAVCDGGRSNRLCENRLHDLLQAMGNFDPSNDAQ